MAAADKERKSNIWKFFVLDEERKKTKCTLCGGVLTYSGGTSTMRNHVKYKHKGLNVPPTEMGSPSHAKQQTSVQRPSSSPQPISESQHSQHDSITRSLALMCALDLRPLNIVSGRGFTNFCKALNSSYEVPTKATVRRHLDALYDSCKLEVSAMLTDCPVSVSTDLWSSVSSVRYITMTGHFITSDWKLVSKILGTRVTADHHTEELMEDHVQQIANEFNITDIPCVVTENAGSIDRLKCVGNFNHENCFSRTLQLAINDGLAIPTISTAVAAAKRLVSYFSHYSLASQKLLEHQERNGCDPVSLIQDNSSHWNSTFLMIQRLLKLRISVFDVLFDTRVTTLKDRLSLDLKDATWKVLEDISPVLEPLAMCTDMLTKEDSPSGSCVHVLIQNLFQNELQATELDSGLVKELKCKVQTGITKRYNLTQKGFPVREELSAPFVTATALDPRFKSLKMLSDDERGLVHAHILGLLQEGEQNRTNQSRSAVKTEASEQDEFKPPDVKKRLLDCLRGDVDLTGGPQHYSVEQELRNFVAEPVRVQDPLLWWRDNANKFSNVARIARRFLSIPAAEAAREHNACSIAGVTVGELRSSLDPEAVEAVVFLHKNSTFQDDLPKSDESESDKSSTGANTPLIAQHPLPILIKKEVTHETVDPFIPQWPHIPSFETD